LLLITTILKIMPDISSRSGGNGSSPDGVAVPSWSWDDDCSLDEELATLFHEAIVAPNNSNKTVGISASSSQFKNCIIRAEKRQPTTRQQESSRNETAVWYWLKIAGLMALMVLVRMSAHEFEQEKLPLGTQPLHEERDPMGIWFEDDEEGWSAPSVSYNSTNITANANIRSSKITPNGSEDPDHDEEETFSDSPGVPENSIPNNPRESEGIQFEEEAKERRKEEVGGNDKVKPDESNNGGGKK
jgi:hypothetical protein